MFNRTGWIIGVIAGLFLIVGFHSAAAEHRGHRHIKFTFGGTYLILPPLSSDGVAANWFTSEMSGTLGTYSSQGVNKSVSMVPSNECPGGVLVIDELNGGFGVMTGTFANGDLIYSQISTRIECLDGKGGFTGSDTGVFVGGTGKFAGVSGTYELSWSGVAQFSDPKANPPQEFGSFTGNGTGILLHMHDDD